MEKLPRKLNKREAKIDSKVLKWFELYHDKSSAVEVKIKGNKLKPHQEVALNQVQAGAFSYKMPDTGVRLPFDGFVLKNAEAWVVTCDGNECEAVRRDGKVMYLRL